MFISKDKYSLYILNSLVFTSRWLVFSTRELDLILTQCWVETSPLKWTFAVWLSVSLHFTALSQPHTFLTFFLAWHPSPVSLQNTSFPLSLHPVHPLDHWSLHWSPHVPRGQIPLQPLTPPPFFASPCLWLLCFCVSANLSACLIFSTGSGMMGFCRKRVLMEPWPSLHYL